MGIVFSRDGVGDAWKTRPQRGVLGKESRSNRGEETLRKSKNWVSFFRARLPATRVFPCRQSIGAEEMEEFFPKNAFSEKWKGVGTWGLEDRLTADS